MAIIPQDRYPGGTVEGDAGYPHGRARNISQPGDGTGYPWEQDGINDTLGFQQALLSAAGITPTGNPDSVGASQYLDALKRLFDRPSISAVVSDAPNTDELFDLTLNEETTDSGYVIAGAGGGAGNYIVPPTAGYYLVSLSGTFLYDPFTSPPTTLQLQLVRASQEGLDALDMELTNVDQRNLMFSGTKLFRINTVALPASFALINKSNDPVLPVSAPVLTITRLQWAPNGF